MSMYNPPSEQHDTGVEGGEFVDADQQDADASRIEHAVREADMTNGEPDATAPSSDDDAAPRGGEARSPGAEGHQARTGHRDDRT